MTEDIIKNNIRTEFTRQRRNIIALSLFLLVYQSLGVELEKINLFGNELRVLNPDYVSKVMWVIYAYFLIRYYQYFHDTTDRGVKEAYDLYVRKLIINRGANIIMQKCKQDKADLRKQNIRCRLLSVKIVLLERGLQFIQLRYILILTIKPKLA
jgi:hypothetical protein